MSKVSNKFLKIKEKLKVNKIATVLFILGIAIIVLGTITSFVLGCIFPLKYPKYFDGELIYTLEIFNWKLFLIGLAISFAVSIFPFFIIGEIIYLLQKILNVLTTNSSHNKDTFSHSFEQEIPSKPKYTCPKCENPVEYGVEKCPVCSQELIWN